MAGINLERDGFRLLPDVVHPHPTKGAMNQYHVTFSHPHANQRDIPSHVWAKSSIGALKCVKEEMFKAAPLWEGWEVELSGGIQYGKSF
ncbi:hypothetical protein ACIQ6V_15475 [Streptomyces sp. NPDC096198]|uniref:hypothetical protein n=1 Tax=Streptomyces sp. NPDC096198 TaxID=3366080 RepID=UPI00381A2250